MPPAKRSTSRRRTTIRKSWTTRKSSASKEPGHIKSTRKPRDSGQDALTALRKDVTKDVSSGTRGLYKDLEKYGRDARRDSGKFGKALQKDVERLQKQLASAARGKRTSAAPHRKPASRSTGKL